MIDKKEYPEPVEALILILVTFGFILGITVVMAVIAVLLNPKDPFIRSTLIMYSLGGILFLLVPIFYVKARNYNGKNLFRINSISKEVAILSILLGITMAIGADELDRLIQLIIPIPEWMIRQLDSLKAETFSDWILLILGVVIIASVSEELLFRGFLQVSLERKGDVTRAVLLSSLSWTIIHMNPYWAVQIFVMGVIIGFLAWRTNSIIPGIIAHATNNLLSLFSLNFNLEEKMGWYSMGDHVSPLVLIPALLILIWCIRQISDIYQNNFVESDS